MTRTRTPFARLAARLRHDERGFSLVETVIAAGVIFASLLTLAFTATAGFGYQGLARHRQAATGLANQVMEEVRGLAYEKIEAGLSSTDLAGDPNIVSCSGTYRFLSCTADPDEPGSGEAIVHSAGLSNITPLVPHRSSTAPNTDPVLDGITYRWATYVTRDDSVANSPYRVTVIVTWTGGLKANAPNKLVRVQSLFWSPDGCRSTETHPFAAPCQPFFYGTSIVPQSSVEVQGSVDAVDFASGQLLTPKASSSAQEEQTQRIQGSWTGAELVLVEPDGDESVAGGTSGSTLADSDPATATGTYSRYRCPEDVTCASGSLSRSASGNSISFSAPGTTAESDSTTSAGGVNVCPPPSATAETDGLLCGGGRILQGGTLSATLTITDGGTIAPGAATLARLAEPGSASTSLVHRNAYPNTTGCSPGSSDDGCVRSSTSRTLGTINLGGLPSGFTGPAGWSGTDAWNGYLVSVVGYTDSATASAGTQSPLPTASQSGTIYYWNGTGYSSLSVTDAGVSGLASSVSVTQDLGGRLVTVEIATVGSGCAPGSTSVTPTSPSGNDTRTEATASSTPPTLQLSYRISEGAAVYADLTITVNLGTLEASGIYQQAPVEGS
jgi:type II secretory pathway pseudopilin PulG